MNIENIRKLEVLKNSRKYMKWALMFPSDDEVAEIKDNEYSNIRFLVGMFCSMYFAIGTIIHLVMNVHSE